MRRSANGKTFLLLLCLAMAVMCSVTYTGDARATEGGGGAYANGGEDFMGGALAPPGTYVINYMTYYRATKFKDNDGNDVSGFSLDAFADVFRLIHVTNQKILGADWAIHAFLPIVYLNVKIPTGDSDNRWGIGDIIIDPFILGWHSKNWHVVTGLDIFVPVGAYNKDRLANAGRHYWTFEPVVGVTYLNDCGFEVSSKFMYDFNAKNTDTEYRSGQEFHFDYTIGYHIQNWALGLGGYFYYQTTDDEQNGETYMDGFKGRVFALGPEVKYGYKNMTFLAKWQHELKVRNKPEGDRFWFNFMYAF
jgi:hypothetical protein